MSVLGETNVLLNGRARDYYVQDFPGPLSIKTVVSGRATWQTDEGRFEIGPGSCVILNDRQPYSILVESKTVVETFCVFFARGFVEDIERVVTTSDAAMLDEPFHNRPVEFHERARFNDSVLMPIMQRLYLKRDDESLLVTLAQAMVGLRNETIRQATRLTAAKASTKEELLRRVHRGRNAMEGSLTGPLSLTTVAREAALSPYHFHRTFTRLFGETPHNYVTRRRMEHAAELLKNTDMPVTEICLVCGFQSPGSFSSLFRRQLGISPQQFRQARF